MSAIALTQDSGGKKDITSNKNKKGNDDALGNTDSGIKDEEVNKNGNDNARKVLSSLSRLVVIIVGVTGIVGVVVVCFGL